MPIGLMGFQKGNKLGRKFFKGHQITAGIVKTEEWRKKLSDGAKKQWREGRTCKIPPMLGKKHTESVKSKISSSLIENWKQKTLSERKRPDSAGEKNWNWKGGISGIRNRDSVSAEYKEWRRKVFERDNYTCIFCGYDKGHIIEADHIFEYSKYPKLIYDVENGRTLCKPCHIKRHKKTFQSQKPVILVQQFVS